MLHISLPHIDSLCMCDSYLKNPDAEWEKMYINQEQVRIIQSINDNRIWFVRRFTQGHYAGHSYQTLISSLWGQHATIRLSIENCVKNPNKSW